MSKKKGGGGGDYGRGYRDGKRNEYSPPKDKKYDSEERKNYDQGRTHGYKDRNKGGCFLTTACTNFAGLSDDCHELGVLRGFRDNYVVQLEGGNQLLAEYYSVAPVIVDKILASQDSHAWLQHIFQQIQLAVATIEDNRPDVAFNIYADLFNNLKTELL